MSEGDDLPVLFVGHAELPDGIRSAVEMIMGPQERLATVQLGPAADPAEISRTIEQTLDVMGVDPAAGALILADLPGGSPSNAAAAVFLQRRQLRLVAGLSLPMALEVLADRYGRTAEELAEVAVAAGQMGTVDVSRNLAAAAGDS
ncbi:MAG: sugar transporter subunit [Frankiales bacterium]|nr:sugar transporter subunit [Frankiales bacterium]